MKTSIKLLLKPLLADIANTDLAWPERGELCMANFPRDEPGHAILGGLG